MFDGLLKEANKMYVQLKQEAWWIQPLRRFKLFIYYSIPEARACLDLEVSKSKV